jgi:hypothetical protein
MVLWWLDEESQDVRISACQDLGGKELFERLLVLHRCSLTYMCAEFMQFGAEDPVLEHPKYILFPKC